MSSPPIEQHLLVSWIDLENMALEKKRFQQKLEGRPKPKPTKSEVPELNERDMSILV